MTFFAESIAYVKEDRGRRQILLRGMLEIDGEWKPFRVKDISATGLKGCGIDDMPERAEVQIRIRESQPFSAEVVWSKDNLFGLCFRSSIEPEDFQTSITGCYRAPVPPPPIIKRSV